MAIIEQNGIPNALPDFRNMGVILRVLLTVNITDGGAGSIVRRSPLCQSGVQSGSFTVEALFLALTLLYIADVPKWPRSATVLACWRCWQSAGLRLRLVYLWLGPLLDLRHGEGLPRLRFTPTALIGMLRYFRCATKALSPALMGIGCRR